MTSRIGSDAAQARRGLSLVELMASVVLLAVGSVVVMHALALAAYAQAILERRSGAYLVALSKLAGLELAFREGTALEDRAQEHGSVRIGEQGFIWNVRMAPWGDDPHVRVVDLTVAWREGDQISERPFDTILRGPQETP